ncbi:MAG: ATP-binding cassette domain-containing protein [Inquilinus sp.]|nr:ATP-binding cassette domain-containing protein [Inquilinus sp.]
MSATAMLSLQEVTRHFPLSGGWLSGASRRAVRAVDGVSLEVRRGETLAIVGESGCGKSTLAKLMLRLDRVTSGSIHFDGNDLTTLGEAEMRPLRRRLQIIFQDPFASLNPRMTVGDMLREPLVIHRIGGRREREARVRELIDLIGLTAEQLDRYPHEFSGGQRQRIGIARALMVHPELVVGDEPVSALDVSVQAQVINLLADLKQRFHLTLVVISHDLAVVKHMSDRAGVMYLGKLVEMAGTRALFAEPRHPYTQGLLAAVPRPDPAVRGRPAIIEGDVPSPIDPPAGCRFHTRCPHARERCRVEEPALSADRGDHAVACHFWREIDGIAPARGAPSLPYQQRLDLFVRGRAAQDAALGANQG